MHPVHTEEEEEEGRQPHPQSFLEQEQGVMSLGPGSTGFPSVAGNGTVGTSDRDTEE